MSVFTLAVIVICCILIAASCNPATNGGNGTGDNGNGDNGTGGDTYDTTVLNAVPVTTLPAIDGAVDGLWSDVPALTTALGDGMETSNCMVCHALTSDTSVTLKAVHDGSRVALLASWEDATASLTRSGSWVLDSGVWARPNGDQSEDRIAFFWPISEITSDVEGQSTGGCMTKCHTQDLNAEGRADDAYLASGTADLWHGKAARSLGVTSGSAGASASSLRAALTIDSTTSEVTAGQLTLVGYMDDTWVGQYDPANEDGGRFADEGQSTYANNRIGDGSRPKYMETNPTDYADAMVLTQAEIDAGEVVGDADTGVSDEDAATYWPNYLALNAVVPERILREPAGSRGDIVQAATWVDGVWTTEIVRDLDTGNADDIAFRVGQQYVFGVAVIDNGGGDKHRPSGRHTMVVHE